MIVKKEHSNKSISNEIIEAKTLKDNAIGLISKNSKQGIFIKTRFGIHTFGMKREIDVLVLSSNHQIVKIKSKLGVNRIFTWNPKYKLVLELPKGLVEENDLKVGDKLTIKG